MREAIATGASIEEAKDKAVEMLGNIGDHEVELEVIDMPQPKILGIFGGKPAKVRAYVEGLDNKPSKKPVSEKKPIEKKAAPAKKAEKPIKKEEPKIEKKSDAPVTYGVKNAESTVNFVKDILSHMDIGEFTVTSTDIENGIKIDIDGEGMGAVIGRRGETLDAIQYLASLHCNHGEEGDFRRVVLDTSGYRDKREQTLQALAAKTARHVLRSGRSQSLEPMNPYERRIIHTAVQDIDGVTSWSVSDGKNRRVIIGFEKGNEPAPRPRSGGRGSNGRRPYGNKPKANTTPAAETKNETGDGPMYGRIG